MIIPGPYPRAEKLWNMKVAVIRVLTIVADFGNIPNKLEKRLEKLEIRGRIETTQTTAVERYAKIIE